ncbi:MAG: tRNA adenosine(34) deaminase TadA [Egibacteraceae bacterium]
MAPSSADASGPDDASAMRLALDEAEAASAHGDVPVGAVVLRGGTVLAGAHNRRELDKDPTAHAELLVLRSAAQRLGSWRLEGCTLYVTLEPCTMCAGAMVLARLPRLVYGASDPKAGAAGSLYDLTREPRLNHLVERTGGLLAAECGALLREFFAARRAGRPASRPVESTGRMPDSDGGVA